MLTPPKPSETRSPPKPSATSTSPSPAPSPAQHNQPHDSILNILKKSGGFVVLVKLLWDTHVANEINSQLADLNDGITFFAPTDTAFSELNAGMLNSLTGEQQIQLMLFHVVPTYLSTSQFQTVSNPLMTKAGGSGHDEFPLNVTTYGDKVVVFTGVNNASIESAVFSDGRLVIYEVGKVLLPVNIFKPGGSYTQTPVAESVEEKPNDVATTLATSGERRGFSGKAGTPSSGPPCSLFCFTCET